MHDLLIAKDILKAAIGAAEEKKLKKINKISIKFGKAKFSHRHNSGENYLEEICPENLKFNLSLIAKNTLLENAKIEIIDSPKNEIRLKEIEGE